MNSFYSEKELAHIGFKEYGTNVLISKKVSIYSPERIKIGNHVRIDDFCILSGNIELGSYIHISAYTSLFAGSKGIIAKDFSTISSGVVVYGKSDDYSGEYMTNPMVASEYTNVIEGRVEIGKHVIIGTRSVVLPDVVIGTGVAIGAMSLVNKSLAEWGIYVGVPCRFMKARCKKILELEKAYIEKEENRKRE